MINALFYYSKLTIGGAEKSSVRMINALSNKSWKIDLLLDSSGGELEKYVDSKVKIYYLYKNAYGNRIKSSKNIVEKLLLIFPYIYSKIRKLFVITKMCLNRYDFSGILLHSTNAGLISKFFNAKIKAHWIRNDLSFCDPQFKITKNILKYSKNIDYYICVAQTVKDSLLNRCPELTPKAIVLYNFLNKDEMLQLSTIGENPYKKDTVNILSVCRIVDFSKGVFRMLDICDILYKEGLKFAWHIIGDGKDFDELKRRTKLLNLENIFLLHGQEINPFPFYKYADFSAVLSYFEGLCGIVNESKIMGIPVIATEFSGIYEQLTNGINGVVVANNQDAILVEMRKMILDENYRKKFRNTIYPTAIIDDNYKLEVLEKIIGEVQQ